jgi:calcium-binding protein CML
MQKKMLAPSTGSLSQRVFEKYDEDSDGSITVANLKKMCMEMGTLLTDQELEMAVKVLDVDGNGTIEYNEFEAWWRQDKRFERLRRSEAEMAFLNGAFASFMSFDADGNGTIDRSEFVALHAVISSSGYPTHDEETDWMDMDRDGSGAISFNEYVEWLFRKASEAAAPKVQLTSNP